MSELLAEPRNGESLDRLGPTAIVSYLNILVFALASAAVFYLLIAGIEPPAVMAGVLGTVLGATGAGLSTTNQFWLGGNIGAKTATTALKQIATSTPTTTITAPAASTQIVTPANVAPPAEGAPPNPSLDIPDPGAPRG